MEEISKEQRIDIYYIRWKNSLNYSCGKFIAVIGFGKTIIDINKVWKK